MGTLNSSRLPDDVPDRHLIEVEICELLDEACVRLETPSSKSHHDLLLAFHYQIQNCDTSGFDELIRLLKNCVVYQTPEDGLCWTPDQLPVQLEGPGDDGFNVSIWARKIIKLIDSHRSLNQG